MNFLIDAQLPPALVPLLRSAGHGATHVADTLAGDAPDAALLAHAAANAQIIISKDSDFAQLLPALATGQRVTELP